MRKKSKQHLQLVQKYSTHLADVADSHMNVNSAEGLNKNNYKIKG